MTRLVVMEGDGIGPEIGAVTVEVLREADRRFSLGLKFTTAAIGRAQNRHGRRADLGPDAVALHNNQSSH